jgi:hypothetical protein
VLIRVVLSRQRSGLRFLIFTSRFLTRRFAEQIGKTSINRLPESL